MKRIFSMEISIEKYFIWKRFDRWVIKFVICETDYLFRGIPL
jgi:hypothetical protein